VIRNIAEEHVTTAYQALLPHFPDFCGCEVCRDDVLVFTLNRIVPRYVSSLTGSVVTEVDLKKEQSRAAIQVAMMEALRRISLTPRCGGRGKLPDA
jgi:late competence development protein ComFB